MQHNQVIYIYTNSTNMCGRKWSAEKARIAARWNASSKYNISI